jgi:hypothetical protein
MTFMVPPGLQEKVDVRDLRGRCLPQDRRNGKRVKMLSVEENPARGVEPTDQIPLPFFPSSPRRRLYEPEAARSGEEKCPRIDRAFPSPPPEVEVSERKRKEKCGRGAVVPPSIGGPGPFWWPLPAAAATSS